jgi:hypothetical protein
VRIDGEVPCGTVDGAADLRPVWSALVKPHRLLSWSIRVRSEALAANLA